MIVYAVANQNAGGHAAALKGLAIPLTLCPAKTTKLDNHGIVYTGSPLICIPVKKVNAPSYVMVALNISADSLVSLGLHPPEDKDHFFLVFGRIETSTYQQQGGSSVSYNNGSQNNNYNIAPIYNGSTTNRMGGKDGGVGSHANPSMRGGGGGIDMRGRGTYQGGGRGSGPLQRSPHAMQPQGHGGPHGSSGGPNSGGGRGYDQQHPVYPPAPVLPQRGGGGGGGGGGNRHPGDWMCPVCKLLVFAYKPDCFRCHTLRPDKIGGGGGGGGATSTPHIPQTPLPRQPPRTNIRPDGDLRDGDWICELCSGHNFASKIACFTCRAPRPPGYELPPSATVKEGEGAAGGPTPASRQILPGDWTCPNCKENVFAKRSRCYKCSTSKSASFH